MTETYDFKAVEAKWRPVWRDSRLYEAQPYDAATGKPAYYILDYFPYPSGAGLSVGHCRNYVPTCVASRFLRRRGFNVLHPMGWDSFGLPAENFALKHGVHPAVTTRRHEATYRRQMELVACSYDWSRELSSTDPDYYRWTQWFFLLLHRRGLAYRAEGNQWWCPGCQTILANEQVEDGRCWRCDSLVTKKALQQWYFKITDYADRLLADLEDLDWPEPIKAMQRNWIGRSEGAEVAFAVAGGDSQIVTFTTRPDTLFGVTFLALAPEHPLARELATAEQADAVAAFVEEAQRRDEQERSTAGREARCVFTGRFAVHPLTGASVPIWIADYVLLDYGGGAVMGVPAHDQRDYAFARKYRLPIHVVVAPPDGATEGVADGTFTGRGVLVRSGLYDGMESDKAAQAIARALAERGQGGPAVSYKMRDWLISRQRYWGAPIPIIHCPDCGAVPVPDSELPVLLPHTEDFAPAGDGRSPLARIEEWVSVPCPHCGGAAQRETDTMDGFACSSWYFLRFASPHETERPFDPDAVRYWLPVDTYVGGAEHAVMHLLYARFWTKVMADAGLIDFVEPFAQLRNQGVLHAADGRRMSKSKGNVVTPDEVIAEHGTDALRTYVLFIGPFDANVNWDTVGIRGVTRFLDRYWGWAHDVGSAAGDGQASREYRRRQHATIKRVTSDMEAFKFNTAVAALMEWLNYLTQAGDAPAAQQREALSVFTQLLAPMAPFITEEVWQERLGETGSVHQAPWPEYDEAALAREEIPIAVQVNGRLRDTVTVAAGSDDATLRTAALASPNVQRHVDGRSVHRLIVVPGRLVNVVLRDD